MSQTQDQLKQQTAEAAQKYVLAKIAYDDIVGVGTGSTVNFFIDALATSKNRFGATVASSEASAKRLRDHGIEVLDLNEVDGVAVYVDGADEINPRLEMIKGGGGALTREKIIAAVADEFVCIADDTKWVEYLGEFALPVEVIPMARGYVWRQLLNMGAKPVWREGVLTDNGNVIIDVHGLHPIGAPKAIEEEINNIVGVVTNGLFALRPADLLLLARKGGVEPVLAKDR